MSERKNQTPILVKKTREAPAAAAVERGKEGRIFSDEDSCKKAKKSKTTWTVASCRSILSEATLNKMVVNFDLSFGHSFYCSFRWYHSFCLFFFKSVGLRVLHQDLRSERLDFRKLEEAVHEMAQSSQ